jgi:hypothetical protein
VVGETIASALAGAANARAIAKGNEIPISFRIIFLKRRAVAYEGPAEGDTTPGYIRAHV